LQTWSRETDYPAFREFVKQFSNPIAALFSVCFREQPMANQRAFGRRINLKPKAPVARAEAKAVTPVRDALLETSVEPSCPLSTKTDFPPLDEDKQDWQAERKQGFKLPWRQLSFMASLCFGLASLVLPEWANDNVQWLLYALMAASLYAGFSKRRREAKSRSSHIPCARRSASRGSFAMLASE
jgi:hypothetical protein